MTTVENVLDETVTLVDGANGIYIPQVFADSFFMYGENAHFVNGDGEPLSRDEMENIKICHNSNNDEYWNAWDLVLSNVYLKSDNGTLYSLHDSSNNGDLIAIPVKLLADLDCDKQDEFWSYV